MNETQTVDLSIQLSRQETRWINCLNSEWALSFTTSENRLFIPKSWDVKIVHCTPKGVCNETEAVGCGSLKTHVEIQQNYLLVDKVTAIESCHVQLIIHVTVAQDSHYVIYCSPPDLKGYTYSQVNVLMAELAELLSSQLEEINNPQGSKMNTNFPKSGHSYTYSEILQLKLGDEPFLRIDKVVIQDSHVTEEEMLGIPGFGELRWIYIRTTHEQIPLFDIHPNDRDALTQLINRQSYKNSDYDDDRIYEWITFLAFPRQLPDGCTHVVSMKELDSK